MTDVQSIPAAAKALQASIGRVIVGIQNAVERLYSPAAMPQISHVRISPLRQDPVTPDPQGDV